MGAVGCKTCATECNTGCADCTDGPGGTILDRRHAAGDEFGHKAVTTMHLDSAGEAAAVATPEGNLELDLEELGSDQSMPSYPAGTQASRTFRTGAVYSGQWRGRARHGFGFQSWPDGASYAGQWAENIASGQGVYTFPDGSAYVGEWERNRFHGLGAYYDVSRTVFRGEWEHGQREGLGVEESGTWPGTKYAGLFSDGLKEGDGMCAWSDGGEYCGQWRGNQITGSGVYACSERRRRSWPATNELASEPAVAPVTTRRYKGQWGDSMKHGVGFYEWPDGRVYKGQYWQDQASGFGAFSWPDGQRYEGNWQLGKQHGTGRYTDAESHTRHLLWVEGRPQEDSAQHVV